MMEKEKQLVVETVEAVKTQPESVEAVLDTKKITPPTTPLVPKRLTRVVTSVVVSEW